MRSHPTVRNPSRQKGLALIILIIAIALAFISYIVSQLSVPELKLQQEEKTITALNKAKQALLDFAVLYVKDNPGYHGFMPCPDVVGNPVPAEGGSDPNCNDPKENTLGLFPWAGLDTGILRSSSGNCLWYAVSGEYKHDDRTEMLNEDSNGAFRIYDAEGNIRQGANPEDRVVAVIFDPSSPLPGQNRNFNDTSDCGFDYASTEYLEGDGVINNSLLLGGALTIDDFINRGMGTDQLPTPFNDQLVTITRQELWDAVTKRQGFLDNANSTMKRLTEALARCVAAYGNNSLNRRLPSPAPVDFVVTPDNDYRLDANYQDDVALYHGRYPYKVDNSDTMLGANAPNGGEPIIFNKGYCNPVILADTSTFDLKIDLGNEEDEIWKNWKDHFFYAVSKAYEPNSVADVAGARCGAANCITVGGPGNHYAAVVFYAGARLGAQVRNEPKFVGDADTKNDITNYLEFPIPPNDGIGDYTPVITGNDIAFCIEDSDALDVVSCSP